MADGDHGREKQCGRANKIDNHDLKQIDFYEVLSK